MFTAATEPDWNIGSAGAFKIGVSVSMSSSRETGDVFHVDSMASVHGLKKLSQCRLRKFPAMARGTLPI